MGRADEKTAFVVPYRFVPPTNGGHKAAYGFAKYLSRYVDLKVLSSTDNQADNLPFELERLFSPVFFKYFNPFVAIRFWRYFRKNNIRHCILHQPFIGLLLWPVCWILGVRKLVFVQNIEYQRFRTLHRWFWPLVYLVEWYIYKTADALLFISPADMPEGIKAFGLKPKRCGVVPYGTDLEKMPTDRELARKQIAKAHHFPAEARFLIFFGPQNYSPNLKALERILLEINPLLESDLEQDYRFLICGGGLPAYFENLEAYNDQNVYYLGFVEDIETYVKAADILVNPIDTGGGVKTKIIEALAVGTSVVSSQTGAIGVEAAACGNKLVQVGDSDYAAFSEAIIRILEEDYQVTPATFYQLYAWPKAIQGALPSLKK